MKIYTVAEITASIKELLETAYPEVWITGEISNFRAHHSGHCYFNLKDEAARLNAVMFRGDSRGLRFAPADGLAVICQGRITVYPPRGDYQIVVVRMEPQGFGALQLAFEQLKHKLQAEGLFQEEKKKPIPELPCRIGVISSISGAAIRDILQVATRRYPNIEILIHPVAVQGTEAAPQIVKALETMNEQFDVDVLILARGGGSIEDLWAFNEESVARAIATSRLPVISAVGHETDFTIADFVADVRAPTPSAAAELAVPNKSDLAYTVVQWRYRLINGIQSLLEVREERFKQWRLRLRDPRQRLNEMVQRIDELRERLLRATSYRLDFLRLEWKRLQSSLRNLNPLAILERGYCVATPRGSTKPITSVKQLKIGDQMALRFAEGGALTELLKKHL